MDELLFTETFEEFLQCLQEHELTTYSKFVVTNSRREFTLDKDLLDLKKKIHWQDGVPFLHFGTRTYSCHQGKDTNLYQKRKYAEERDRKVCIDHDYFTNCSNSTHVTKKLNCPASINVTRIMRFISYKMTGEISDYEKTKTSKKIKETLQNEDIGEMGYMFNLPPPESHQNHLLGPDFSSIVPGVREKVSKLVLRGKRSATVNENKLFSFVENDLQEKNEQSKRRFYQNLDTEGPNFEDPTLDTTSFDEIQNAPSYNNKGSRKRRVINDCNMSMRSIQSVLWNLNESNLRNLSSILKDVFKVFSSKVEDDSGLPMENQDVSHQSTDPVVTARVKTEELGQLEQHPKKGFSRTVGAAVDMLKEHSVMYVVENSEGPESKKIKLVPKRVKFLPISLL